MIYQAYHSNRQAERMIRGLKIAAAVMTIAVISYLLGYNAHAEEARIIYAPGTDIIGMNAEVCAAPGSSESAIQITTNNYEQLRTTTNNYEQLRTATNNHEYSSISMTAAEREELRRVVAAEAQNQRLEGRKAVVEVIFNRVLSASWPNSIHGVLSQKGQFAGYKLRNAKWVVPEYADAAIDAVLTSGRTVLPSTRYVYFDTKGTNGSSHVKIGAHYFGR